MMSRLAGFYIAKAVESVAGGMTAAFASRVPARRAGAHAALDSTRAHDRRPSTWHRVADAAHRFIGSPGRASRGAG
jgi:hypothetical protein